MQTFSDTRQKASPIEESFENFMNLGVEIDDPYWDLFKVKEQMNTALLKAVEYGYKEGYNRALLERGSK